jgi:hypothetical protein
MKQMKRGGLEHKEIENSTWTHMHAQTLSSVLSFSPTCVTTALRSQEKMLLPGTHLLGELQQLRPRAPVRLPSQRLTHSLAVLQ